MRYHVVWDWNGTIFDDAELAMAVTSDNFRRAGFGAIPKEAFQAAYRRPLRDFYHDLAGQPLSDHQWDELNDWWHEEYERRVQDVRLANGVEDALAFVVAKQWTQSLLSMYPDEELLEIVKAHNLTQVFTRIDGTRNNTSWRPKAEYLAAHVEAVAVQPDSVILVGDTEDDIDAARQVGISAILFDGGMHPSHTLHDRHDVVARTMAEVIDILSSSADR